MFLPTEVRAADAERAQQLSDSAFVMLNSMNASSAPGASDAQGAVASFAGDAQSLASALGKDDRAGASQAMAALVADRRSVDQVLARHPGAAREAQWAALKTLLASLERDVPVARAGAGTRTPAGDAAPPASETAMLGRAPRVSVSSREFEGGGVRVRGYLQGTDLKSAGIYDGERLIHPIQLSSTTGEQRVNFNFKLLNVAPNNVIRVTDGVGRTAEARVAPEAAIAAPSNGGDSKLIEIGPGAGSGASAPSVTVRSDEPNIAEIPSHKGLGRSSRRSASRAPRGPSELADVQINILGVLGTSRPNTYQVVGQITGSGVHRAGIYVDGRLRKPIPLTPGYTSFDVSFTMLGREAAIRVFDKHNNFIESSIDTDSARARVYGSNPPIVVNPYAYGANPYARPYPYGYPPNPYGNPYGSPNPYAPSPYGYGRTPYGYPNPPPNAPWWRNLLP